MNPLNPQALALARAIRQHESGGDYARKGASKEYGAYQWTPDTWKAHAKEVLGDENADITNPTNQNKVAYTIIEKDLKKGLTPAQVAAKWNSGSPTGWENKRGTNEFGVKYDVPAYVNSVGKNYTSELAKVKMGQDEAPKDYYADPANQGKKGVWFKSDPNDSAIVAGAKTAGNVLPSAFNFAKGALDLINPLSTYKKIKEIVSGTKELAQESGGYANAFGAIAKETPKAAYETVVPEAARDLIKGDTQGAQRSITEDPFGQIAPFVFGARAIAERGGGIPSRTASEATMRDYVQNIGENTRKGVPIPTEPTRVNPVDVAMEKTTDFVTAPFKKAGEMVKEGVSRATKFGVSQVTGLNPDTVTEVTQNPTAFGRKAIETADRAALGQEVQSSLSKRFKDLSETGKEYDPIRNSETPVKVAKTFIGDTLKEMTGVDIKNGKITTSGKADIRDATDVRALQNLYDLWDPVFKKGTISANEFLNFRSDLAKLSRFERQIGKSTALESVAQRFRGRTNTAYRPQLEGLDKLDEDFSKQTGEIKTLSKNLVDKNGNLTDAAINRIANATGKGKDALLARLEEIVPGITQKIKILKAVEDIKNSSGIKVGTYGRGAFVGGGLLLGGPLQAVINMILTSPELAVPILRQYGLLKNSAALRVVIDALKKGSTTIDALPTKLPIMNDQNKSSVFGK